MKSNEFSAAFDDEDKQVRLLNLFGSTGSNGGIHLYIDKYFIG